MNIYLGIKAVSNLDMTSFSDTQLFQSSSSIPETSSIMPRRNRYIAEGTVVGPWTITKRLGRGGFGHVYLAESQYGLKRAIKFSFQDRSSRWTLEAEQEMYNAVHGQSSNGYQIGILANFEYGRLGNRQYLVMERAGKTLSSLLIDRRGKFSTQTVLKVGIQLLYRLESIHRSGYVHRDICPDNAMIGYERRNNIVYLVDFGLGKKFRTAEGHVRNTSRPGMTGKYEFCSVNAHKGNELSRRDDMLSLGFLLAYLRNGKLPWNRALRMRFERERTEELKKLKTRAIETSFFYTICSALGNYMKHVSRLGFEDRPDYWRMRHIFRTALQERGIAEDDAFEWERNEESE